MPQRLDEQEEHRDAYYRSTISVWNFDQITIPGVPLSLSLYERPMAFKFMNVALVSLFFSNAVGNPGDMLQELHFFF